MNDITFTCLTCNQKLKGSSDMAGTTIECPSCKNQMVVPGLVQPEPRPLFSPPETKQVIERLPESRVENNEIHPQDSMEKPKTFGFEKTLFGITRTFALGGSAFILLMIVALILKLMFSHENTNTAVTYNQVAAEILGGSSVGEESGGAESKRPILVEIPDKLKEYFKGSNESILREWLENLDETQQKDFIRNLVQVVKKAESNKTDVLKAINAYKYLKFSKFRTIENNKYQVMIGRIGVIASVFIMLLILSVLSLVLVMLAIERNTRKDGTNVYP